MLKIFVLNFAMVFSLNAMELVLYKLSEGVVEFSNCPDSPNCVNSQQGHIPSLGIQGDEKEVFKRLNTYLNNKENVRLLRSEFPLIHAVYKSSVFGFKDDVLFYIDKKEIHFRSSSRVGYYDFNANIKRVEKFKEDFKFC